MNPKRVLTHPLHSLIECYYSLLGRSETRSPHEEVLERLGGTRIQCPSCRARFFVEKGHLVVFYQHGDLTDLPDDSSGHTCSVECAEALAERVRRDHKDYCDSHVILSPGLP